MKNVIYILFGFFILLLELILFNRVSLFGISANILIIYIATLSIFTSLDRVLFVSLFLGLGKDFVFERIFGLNAMILIILGILFGNLKGVFIKKNGQFLFFYQVFHLLFICLSIHYSIECIWEELILFCIPLKC